MPWIIDLNGRYMSKKWPRKKRKPFIFLFLCLFFLSVFFFCVFAPVRPPLASGSDTVAHVDFYKLFVCLPNVKATRENATSKRRWQSKVRRLKKSRGKVQTLNLIWRLQWQFVRHFGAHIRISVSTFRQSQKNSHRQSH